MLLLPCHLLLQALGSVSPFQHRGEAGEVGRNALSVLWDTVFGGVRVVADDEAEMVEHVTASPCEQVSRGEVRACQVGY